MKSDIGHDIVPTGDMDRREPACMRAIEHEGEALQQAPGGGKLGLWGHFVDPADCWGAITQRAKGYVLRIRDLSQGDTNYQNLYC